MQNQKRKYKLLKHIEDMRKLHSVLLLFLQDSGGLDEDFVHFQSFKEILIEQGILHKKQKLKSVLLLILNIYNKHQRSSFFFSKIEQIFVYLEKTIKNTFTNEQIFTIFSSNKLILLFLFDHKIISVNKNIYEYLKHDESHTNYIHFFFTLKSRVF